MKRKDLNDALRLLTKMLNNPGLETGQREQLERAKRELTNAAGAGKLDPEKLFLACTQYRERSVGNRRT